LVYLIDKIICFLVRVLYAKKRFNFHDVKVAYIGNYNANCGISTYNEKLVEAVLGAKSHDKRQLKLRVFAEYADEAQSENIKGDASWVTRCWSRKEHPKVKLINSILMFMPDIVHISHEYGLYPNAYQLTSLVSVLRTHGIKVVATMHSVYEHKDKVVSENAPDYIIVHTQEAKDCLVQKGIAESKISVMPHGSPVLFSVDGEPRLVPKDWNTWETKHSIFQAGFLFEYKGHARMMGIVARLKEKYSDVHYVVQGSENEKHMDEHDRVYDQLVQLSKQLGIEHNVSINRGFVSDGVLLSHIRTVTCCVLPYATNPLHDVRATSGIARMIVATETPLVVSNVHLFDDIKNLVPVASTDDDLYNAIVAVFEAQELSADDKQRRLEFLKETSWENIGNKLLEFYLKTSIK
jgi:glycosyltransferase involved in cell wall biosynthesis